MLEGLFRGRKIRVYRNQPVVKDGVTYVMTKLLRAHPMLWAAYPTDVKGKPVLDEERKLVLSKSEIKSLWRKEISRKRQLIRDEQDRQYYGARVVIKGMPHCIGGRSPVEPDKLCAYPTMHTIHSADPAERERIRKENMIVLSIEEIERLLAEEKADRDFGAVATMQSHRLPAQLGFGRNEFRFS